MLPIPMTKSGKTYRNGAFWIVSSGAIAALGLGGWGLYQQVLRQSPPAITVTVIPVSRETIEETISEGGLVELANQQTLKSPEDATVEQVFVEAGDRVKAGTPLILLRNRQAQKELRNQVIDNQKAAVELTRKQEIVREKLTALNNAEDRLRDVQALLQKGFISALEVQTEQDKVDDARAAVKDAENEQLKATLDIQKGQAALRDIQQGLGDNRLNSPIDALILSVNIKAGDGTKRETDLLTLGNPNQEIVRLQLPTLKASKVRINQLARVSMIGPDAKIFSGRVVSLSPQASASSSDNDAGAQAQAKVDAVVALTRPSNILIPGSQVSVEIILSQRLKVPAVPIEAIQAIESNPFVWIKNQAGQAEKRLVKLGLQSLTQTEVKSGLEVGEMVVLPNPNQAIAPGTPLQTETESSPKSTP